MNTDTIVIYHGGCRDGFASAWVFNKYVKEQAAWFIPDGDVVYHPGFYGQAPPDVKDKHVVILDFAYDVPTMEKIVTECSTLLWIDHHKTAQPVADFLRVLKSSQKDFYIDKVHYIFDNNRSGVGITWDHLFEHDPRPWLVNYVEDRDLWRKALDDSDLINAWIACLEFDFNIWDAQVEIPLETIIERGLTAELKTQQYVREVCKNAYIRNINQSNVRNEVGRYTIASNQYWMDIPTVNICQVDCSEVLHELCKLYPQAPFSLYWFKRYDGMYQYGLRSIGDFDVSIVAKLFGGGGHKNAAGFQLNYLLEELK